MCSKFCMSGRVKRERKLYKRRKDTDRVLGDLLDVCSGSLNSAIYTYFICWVYYRSTIMKKTAKKKRRVSWFSRYFGQSSRPSSGVLMKIRIVVTICSKTVTVDT